MSLSIDDNTVASIHYTLTNNEGETLDSSEGNDPLIYLHGAGNLIPGLEKELKGKSAGHSMQVKVAPEEGYGPVHDGLIDIVPKAAFQASIPLNRAWHSKHRAKMDKAVVLL